MPSYTVSTKSAKIVEEDLIKDELCNTIEEIKGMTFKDRPPLIKIHANKNFKYMLQKVDSKLKELISGDISITEINCINYGAALFIQRKLAPWFDEKRRPQSKMGSKVLPWKQKLKRKVDRLRGELSVMLSSGSLTQHLMRKIHRLGRKYNVKKKKH